MQPYRRGSPRVAAGATIVVSLSALGCQGPAPRPDEHFAATTVTITADGLRPAATAVLPQFGVLVFRNLTAAAVDVRVASPFPPCAQCSTVLGFVDEQGHGIARSLPPQGVASLCFHDVGVFPFTVRTAAGEATGSVRVGGP